MKLLVRFMLGAVAGVLLGWLWGRLNEEEFYDDEYDDEVVKIDLDDHNTHSLMQQHS